MSLNRILDEHEISPELKAIYADVRASFDLPFVPNVFKLSAGSPEYLKTMWSDLGPVVRSKEFHAASRAIDEFVRSLVIAAGWRFSDQEKILAAQKFSNNDIEQLGAIVATFARGAGRMSLFTRLLQRGYSGGQSGRVSDGRHASALSRMITLHVPPEDQGGLRVSLLYNDIRRSLHTKHVMSLFRAISPFPAYLASVWLDSKKLINDPAFVAAREQVSKRAMGLITGLPVKDHRTLTKRISPEEWRSIEEMVDGYARVAPQFALISVVWQRSFPFIGQIIAA
jgi:hypothetical protein